MLSLYIFFCLSLAVAEVKLAVGSSYVAAVYEHHVSLNPEPRVPLSRPEALKHMLKNLYIYEEQAARAAEKGVQILVFPEDGLYGFNFSRSSIFNYLETIPDPQKETWNPCVEPGRYNNTECDLGGSHGVTDEQVEMDLQTKPYLQILRRLSCMARGYHLYLVANMGDLQPCPLEPSSSSACPPDGRWQFNTNVVFSCEGHLVARYHKHNLYFEEAFDAPPQTEIVTFDTPFAGRFGLLTCFDILFHDPTVVLVEKGVRQLIFPTAWMNQLPLLDTIQFQRAFSLGANVTLLASNIRDDHLIMTGSGIYSPFAATYHHAQQGDPEEGRLVVATVPVLEEGGAEWATDLGYCQRDSCDDSHRPESMSPSFISSMMYDPFTFVLLNETTGTVTVCNGTFCCHLQYRKLPQGGSKELYALGAFAGTHTVNGRYALQVCALVRCAGLDSSSCGQEVEEAETKMDFQLEGTFGTRYVYPSILASGFVLEQPQHLQQNKENRVTMIHWDMSAGLVTACLYGRMYLLDNK